MNAETAIERNEKGSPQSGPLVGTEFAITGMTCVNCARHVTEAIQSVPEVRSATVNLEANQAFVRWEAGAQDNIPAVIHAVEEAGYKAQVAESSPHEPSEHRMGGWQLNLWVGVVGTLLIMLGEWVLGLGMTRWFQWVAFVLAGVVQVMGGARFYRGAWTQIKARRSNMDTLVALGSTTAFAYSMWALLSHHGGHIYFMEAAGIITLISVGHWLESRASAQASGALRQLLNLAPPLTRRREAGGAEREVAVEDLEIGDEVLLRPGDHIPTDGEVIEGTSAVDESMLTGESSPVDKGPGARLYAGTVNLNGRLVMNVTVTGEGTALSQIIAAVQRAQSSRANIQRLGDRVSSVFVPVVVAVALAAGACWGLAPDWTKQVHDSLGRVLWSAHLPEGPLAAAFIIAAGVLIVACPCAMGLATPAAIMAGSNAAARRGILIRDGVALEKAGRVTAVLFDKTGTLTRGKPEVVQAWSAARPSSAVPQDQSSASALAAALARHSSHPVSQAVARLSTDGPAFADWQELRGSGVQARLELDRKSADNGDASTITARLGSLPWLEAVGVDLAPGKPFIVEWASQGATIVGLATEDALRGLFAVKDAVKTGALEVVQELERQGLGIYLVTGDNSLTASSIARQTGIRAANVFAQVRPEKKAEFVTKLQERGQRVAFVGDGINDAPALEQADLGIAVSRASDVAREAADIILLKSEIEAVPESLGLARATLRTIKQNLFWAFFYNTISIPLAALGFLSPMLCAVAMGLSDLVVIGNALWLRRWRL